MKKILLVFLCFSLQLQAMEEKTAIKSSPNAALVQWSKQQHSQQKFCKRPAFSKEQEAEIMQAPGAQTNLADLRDDWSFNIQAHELEDEICQCRKHSKKIATFLKIIDKIKSIHQLSACTTIEHILPAYKITDKTISDFKTKITELHKTLQESYNDTIESLHDLHKELTKTQNTLSAIRSGKQYDDGFDELYKIYMAQIKDQKNPITLSKLIQNFDQEIEIIDPLVSELYTNLIQFLDATFTTLQNVLNKKLSDTCHKYDTDIKASFPDINKVQQLMDKFTLLDEPIKTLKPIIHSMNSLTTLMSSQYGDHIKTSSEPSQQKMEMFINYISGFKTHMVQTWLNKSDKQTRPKVVEMCTEINNYFLSLNSNYGTELLPMRIKQSQTLMKNLRGLIDIFSQSKKLLDIHYSNFLATDKKTIEDLLDLLNGQMNKLITNIQSLGKWQQEAQRLIGKHFCPVCHEVATSSCSKCKKTFYCSLACQKIHWKAHKQFCSEDTPLYFTAHVDGNDIRYCTDGGTQLTPTTKEPYEATFSLKNQAYCVDISDAFDLPVLVKMGDCVPYPIYYDTESAKKILADDPYKYSTLQKQNILLSHFIHENMHQTS